MTPKTSLNDFMSACQARAEAALDARLPAEAKLPERLHQAMRYSTLGGGKRLRPLLTYATGHALGVAPDILDGLGAAVEFIHVYSLIHDDLPAMDNDDLRRGKPTCHKAYDEATAILAGDGLLTLSFEVLAREVQPPERAAACCAALARAAGPCNMVGGQADDVRGLAAGEHERSDESKPQSSLPDRLVFLHRRKTGAMIGVSLRLGGLCSDASADQLDALDQYGQRIGLAFQITDDLLDVRSTQETVGKRVGKDAERGKLTFPGLLGLDQSAQHAEQLIANACRCLEPFGRRAEGLGTVARYVLDRDR